MKRGVVQVKNNTRKCSARLMTSVVSPVPAGALPVELGRRDGLLPVGLHEETRKRSEKRPHYTPPHEDPWRFGPLMRSGANAGATTSATWCQRAVGALGCRGHLGERLAEVVPVGQYFLQSQRERARRGGSVSIAAGSRRQDRAAAAAAAAAAASVGRQQAAGGGRQLAVGGGWRRLAAVGGGRGQRAVAAG